jgi:hypothetical protein
MGDSVNSFYFTLKDLHNIAERGAVLKVGPSKKINMER